MNDDHIGAADEEALRAMFAALVEDAAPAELSALEVQRLARAELRATADRRSTRTRYLRNTLIAAVIVGVLALVAPRLVGKGSELTATSVSAGGAATSPAARAAPYGADSNSGDAPSGAGSGSGAPAPAGAVSGSSTAASEAAPAGSSAASSSAAAAGSATSAALPAPMRSAASAPDGSADASSAAGSTAPGSGPASSGGGDAGVAQGNCASTGVPGSVLAAVKAALPGYRGTVRIVPCEKSTLDTSAGLTGSASGTVTFVVVRGALPGCPTSPAACDPVGDRVPGTSDAFESGGVLTVVGPGGTTVTVGTPAGGPDRPSLIAAARSLLKALA